MAKAKSKTMTHIVVKGGLYFTPGEDSLKVDSMVSLSADQAEKLEKRGFVKAIEDMEVSGASGADSKALKKDLKAAEAEVKTLTEDLAKAGDDVKVANANTEAAEAEVKSLKAELAKPAKA